MEKCSSSTRLYSLFCFSHLFQSARSVCTHEQFPLRECIGINAAQVLCMSLSFCLLPFRKLLLEVVHRNLIRWISIIRLMRESPSLTSLLISFTRSISHPSLAVLVTDCQFWRLLRLKVPIIVVTKTLVSATTGSLITLPFRHALLTACGNRHVQTILKSQLWLCRFSAQRAFTWAQQACCPSCLLHSAMPIKTESSVQ